MCVPVVVSVSGAVDVPWTSSSPFLNSDRADPSERASLGIWVLPNSTATTRTMTTIPSIEKISASMALLLFLLVLVSVLMCGLAVGGMDADVPGRSQGQVVDGRLDEMESLEAR